MTTPTSIQKWIAAAPGRSMNPDNHYGLQCVDLVDQYGQDIFGVSWTVCVGGVAGAKALLDRVPDEYWVRTDNNPNNPNLIPSPGDVVVFAGSAINEWGHTAVVESADTNGMWVVQQDGFAAPLVWADGSWYSNKPAHRMWLGYSSNGTGPIAGWLTPKASKLKEPDIVLAPASTIAANQRITATTAKKRTAPNTDGTVTEEFPADTILTFKGFVRGQNVNGNDIWFVGISGQYLWSGNFIDHSTNGLADLTPAPTPAAPAIAANQRITATTAKKRTAPNTDGTVTEEFPADTILTFKGFVRGQNVNGNDIWFVGISGQYLWSGNFIDHSTNGLADLTPATPAPTPTPTPAPSPAPVEESYDFVADFDFVEKIPAHINNVRRAVDNPGTVVFPAKPSHAVIHQFGTLGRDTVGSTINQFLNPNLGEKAVSAHFVVSGKRIIQMVSLKDRAFHAYVVGNDYIGIETDPAQDADTIASVKKLLVALNAKLGYKLTLIRHKNVPQCITSCGDLIDLSKYEVDVVTPVPTPTPTPEPTPAPTPEPDPTPEAVSAEAKAKIISDFQKWQLEQYLKL